MATSSNFSTDNGFIKYRIVVTENSFDRDTNTSEVNVKVQAWRTNTGYTTSGTGTCYCTIDGTKYTQSISSSQTITYNSYTTLLNKTVTIEHQQDGSKTINVSAYIKHQRFNSNSQGFNVSLTTIQRQATIVSIAPFTDVQNPIINYVNPLGEEVDELIAVITATDNHPLSQPRELSKTGVSYTFELTDEEKETIYNYYPNDNIITLKFWVQTYIGGNWYSSTSEVNMTITEALPVIESVEYKDTVSSVVAVTEDDTKIVQNKSKPLFVFSKLQALKGASLSSISIDIGGNTFNFSVSGTSQTSFGCQVNSVLNFSSNVTAVCTLTDSRGYSTSKSVELDILSYSPPTLTYSVRRHNNYYSDTDLYVDVKISSLGGKNELWAFYEFMEVGGEFSGWTRIYNKTLTTISLDNTKQFWVLFQTYDKLYEYSEQYAFFLDSGTPIAFFDRKMKSTGFNCFPTENNIVEVGGEVKVQKIKQRLWDHANPRLVLSGEEIQFTLGQFGDLGERNYTIDYYGTYNGYIEQSHIKNSSPVVLWSGSLSSGSVTFTTGNYNYYLIRGRVSTNGNYITMLIPKMEITDTDTAYQLSNNANFISFRLKHSGNNLVMSYQNRTSGSTFHIDKVYGCF